MPRHAVTLRQIARRLGVHESTVSRALNARTRHLVADDVAERIVAQARDMGYRPNAMAAALRTQRTMTVGVVIPDITNPVFPPIIRGIEDVLYAADYTAIVVNTGDDTARERRILDNLYARRVDGLILGTARDTMVPPAGGDEADVPMVLINRSGPHADMASVVNDDEAGMRLAVDHLVGLGHRMIGHLAGPGELSTGRARQAGFRAAMAQAGLATNAIATCHGYTIEAGRAATDALTALHPDLTALVAANDLLALGAYESLTAHGMSCPDSVSVTGFNDMPLVDRLLPPLTTIRVPLYEMGARAATILLDRLRGEATAPAQVRLPCTLEVRGSTARPRPVA